MIAQDDVLQPYIAESGITKMVMDLLIENPDHSVLHNGGRLLVVELFECRITRAKAVEDCLPGLIAARTVENRALKASMFAIVRMLVASRKGVGDFKDVPGFIGLVTAVRQHADLMKDGYGGPIQRR
jgi:hypothetical protein